MLLSAEPILKSGRLSLGLALLFWIAATDVFAANVTTIGRQILVNNAPFQARGVCYAPTPIGQAGDQPPYGDYFTADHASLHARDLPRMRQMGVNCLRVYGWTPTANHSAFLDVCYNGGDRSIYVMVNRWINPATDWNDANAVSLIIADWLKLATNVSQHPATLGYILGNELNWVAANRQNPTFWAAINRIAGAVRQHDPNHLISTALADSDFAASIAAFDSGMTNFNAWCLQSYRGISFGGLFRDYADASSKPLLITEFGMDALDERIDAEYVNNASLQADYVVSLWNQISSQSRVVAGGFVFAWADEWWKAGTPWVQNEGGWSGAPFPDGWADEEWWGIHRIGPGSGGNPDSLQPRLVFDRLRTLWTAQLSVLQTPPGQIQVGVKGGAGQNAVLQSTGSLQDPSWTAIATNTIPFTNTVQAIGNGTHFFRVELR